MFQRDKEEIITAVHSQGMIYLTYFANQSFYNTDVAERPDSKNKDEKVSPGSSVSCVWNLT